MKNNVTVSFGSAMGGSTIVCPIGFSSGSPRSLRYGALTHFCRIGPGRSVPFPGGPRDSGYGGDIHLIQTVAGINGFRHPPCREQDGSDKRLDIGREGITG